MPGRPTPEAVMQAARNHLKEPPAFTREDGTGVDPNEVPADTRGKLESARRGFLSHIAETHDFARRMSEAIERQDRQGVVALAKEAGLPREMTFRVTGLEADFSCTCSGCISGHCCGCVIT
jgi:hypothetical protein